MTTLPEDEPKFFCLACRDESSSWREFWCPGTGPKRDMVRPLHIHAPLVECGRAKTHGPHAYVARCECAGHNPVAAARRAREQRRRRDAESAAHRRGAA